MIQVPEHIAIIIIKHLRATQSSAEEKELQDWINESEEHKNAYHEMIRLWHESGSVMELPAFDTDSAWDKLDSTLAHDAVAPRGLKAIKHLYPSEIIQHPYTRISYSGLTLTSLIS